MTSQLPLEPPNTRSAWMGKLISDADQWFSSLQRLERHGLYQAILLESGTLALLNISYPEKKLFDANTRKKNHPAVDILTPDRKFGIQVKLTLTSDVIKKARKKWDKEVSASGSLAGATQLWILGASTDPRVPGTTGNWQQAPGKEWAIITDKLRLNDLRIEELKKMCGILQEEIGKIPNDPTTASSQLKDLRRTVKNLRHKHLLTSVGKKPYNYYDLEALARTESVVDKIEEIGQAQEKLSKTFPILIKLISDSRLEVSLEKLIDALDQFSEGLQGAFDTYEAQYKDKKAGLAHGEPNPAGKMLSDQYIRYVAQMHDSYTIVIDSTIEVQKFLEHNFKSLFAS